MATAIVSHRESGSSSSGGMDKLMDSGKYVRYTTEQVEVLERVYSECPKPSSLRRQQLIREFPILSNIEPKQIKVWFQNRRCREKQKKEASRLQTVNRKLNAMNKLLTEENDRLQKQVSQLVYENGYMRQQLRNASLVTGDTTGEAAVTTTSHAAKDSNNSTGLLSIAEETLSEFLSKATGTAVDWIQMPGMKPGPDSIGIVAISNSCNGVAARACGHVTLEPTKIAEMLKDRMSWCRDCRSLEVYTMFPAGDRGSIELLYMQLYAPTTLASARDFWTLRYTTILEDGTIVVCERSLSGSGAGPNTSTASQFVRAEMMPSGFMIRPCEGGGSIIHIVDHVNLEARTVPEVIRSIYESSKVVAQKLTITALRHIRQIAQEESGEVVYGVGRQPAVLRTFGQRLSRGFNDAINGFNDDGWSVLGSDGVEDVIIAVNSNKNLGAYVSPANSLPAPGGVLCAKASMLLQNVPPVLLVQFLREHRSEWADYNVDSYSAASLKAGTYACLDLRPTRFSGNQINIPFAHIVEKEEFLEVVRLEGNTFMDEGSVLSRDVHLMQLCSGADENAEGTFPELIFAPIDESFPDDAPLLPSGFRVIPLDSKTDELDVNRTLDLASTLEVGCSLNWRSGSARPNDSSLRSVLTIAFQFPCENHIQETIATMARQYLRSIVSSVQRVAMVISPRLGSYAGPNLPLGSPGALMLVRWICQSYSHHLGVEIFQCDDQSNESILQLLWQHPDAILCCSVKPLQIFNFANQAGLDMLETTFLALQDIPLEKIFDELGRKVLYSALTKIMQEGYAYLPVSVCLSTMGRQVSFDQAIAWKVMGEDDNLHCIAFAFANWSFL